MVDTCKLVSMCAPYPDEFETFRDPVSSAVNIALAFLRMPDEVELMVPCINHNGPKAVGTLNRLLNEDNCQRLVKMKSNLYMMRLFTCYINFGADANLMIDA